VSIDGKRQTDLLAVPSPRAQIVAVDVLEDHHVGPVLFPEVQDVDDPGVVEVGEEPRFAREQLHHHRVADELRVDALDHDRLGEARGPLGAREVHDAHAAAADRHDHAVAPEEGLSGERVEGHGAGCVVRRR
jgi:hypothetical protein